MTPEEKKIYMKEYRLKNKLKIKEQQKEREQQIQKRLNKECTIYCIIDHNGLEYIGSTNDITRRIKQHRNIDPKCSSKILDYSSYKLKYLELCTEENRFIREQYWMNKYPNRVNKHPAYAWYRKYQNNPDYPERRREIAERKTIKQG